MTVPAFDPSSATLRVVPLGGLGEFGMNMMVYELGGHSIVVDCGMTFPDASILGVDVIIPDMTYLTESRSRLAGIFLTHGHEDHIGATPFLLDQLSVPVYGTPLTLGFLREKLEEWNMLEDVELRPLTPRQKVQAGPFTIEPIHVTHSIVDAVALAIETPMGTILHTGDFKLDQSPLDARPTDLARLGQLAEAGVLLLASDSTNAAVSGYSGSEQIVGEAFEHIFAQARGRIIVTTFASHIHRIQQVVNQAEHFGRQVFFVGRSVVRNVEIAERLRHLRIPRSVRAEGDPSPDRDPKRTVIITTGSQGEPTSALARMALDEHHLIQLTPGDTVVISARTIPGNERAVSHIIDHLFRRGAEVLHDEVPNIHVSGHACREELKMVLNLVRPRYFIPMHGTYRHLVRHAQLAEGVGIPSENIFVVENGAMVEIERDGGRVLEERAPAGRVFIDHQVGEVAEVVVRDRQHLAEDGFVIAVIAVNGNTGKLAREPEIITRGLVHVDESGEMLAEVRDLLSKMMAEIKPEEIRDSELMRDRIRTILKRYFRKKLERRPMILPVVWEM
jgi:ribonuclease J